MLLRLAGMGGKALFGMGAKKGVGAAVGRFGREALADAALVGGITQIPNAIGTGIGIAEGTLVDDRLDKLSAGDARDGKYRIPVMDRLRSSLDQLTGGEGITQESIAGRKQDNLERDMRKLFEKEGGVLTPGGDIGSYNKQLRQLKQDNANEALTRSQPYIDSQERIDLQDKRFEQQRLDTLSKEKQARLDSIDTRSANLAQAMAELDFKKGQSNRDFDYQNRVLDYKSKQRKTERMQQIAMALGGLGSLFAT